MDSQSQLLCVRLLLLSIVSVSFTFMLIFHSLRAVPTLFQAFKNHLVQVLPSRSFCAASFLMPRGLLLASVAAGERLPGAPWRPAHSHVGDAVRLQPQLI